MNVALIGPVYPYRAGIAYCTTRLAEELAKTADVTIVSFKRQYPKRFYPGSDDVDESLRLKTPKGARFELDVINPLTWIRTGRQLRRARPDAVVFVWWIWVWALPYLTLLALLPKGTRVILQCHNIGDKEPSWWKRTLTNRVLRRVDVLVVHARSEAEEAARRIGVAQTLLSVPPASAAQTGVSVPQSPGIVTTFLPVHELGGEIPSRAAARQHLGITANNVALFFGHVRPFKALDVALRAWAKIKTEDALLLVAGEAWWKGEEEYRRLARELGLAAGSLTCHSEHDGCHSEHDGCHSERSACHSERSEEPGGAGGAPTGQRADPPAQVPRYARNDTDRMRADSDRAPADTNRAPADRAPADTDRARAVCFDFRFIPDSEIATYFAAADVVLAPYRIEAQSGVALTAFHFARPVIATTVGGLPEIIRPGSNGYLVPPDDADALAGAIDTFFARRDREIMENAAAESAGRFSWEEYGRVFARLLQDTSFSLRPVSVSPEE